MFTTTVLRPQPHTLIVKRSWNYNNQNKAGLFWKCLFLVWEHGTAVRYTFWQQFFVEDSRIVGSP